MELTTEKIIDMLPLDKEFRRKLLEALPLMDEDTRFMVGKIIWKGYYILYELKLQENLQKALAEGDVKPDGSLYERIEKQTEKEMESAQYETSDSHALSDVREKLEKLLKQN